MIPRIAGVATTAMRCGPAYTRRIIGVILRVAGTATVPSSRAPTARTRSDHPAARGTR